jgi:hypothetical protein
MHQYFATLTKEKHSFTFLVKKATPMYFGSRFEKLSVGVLFCCLIGWMVVGKPHISFLGFPPNPPIAQAANGDVAVFREVTGLQTIGTSVTDITWDATVKSDAPYALQANSTDIDLADAGHYLVMYSVPTQSAGGSNRSEMQSWLRINDTTNLNYGRGQGYIRRSGGADEAYNQGAAIINVSAGDDVRLQMQRTDSNSATVETRPNKSGISLVKLDSTWDFVRSRPTANQTFGSTTSFVDVTLATDDEMDSGGFSRSGAGITLIEGGKYLVTYNIGVSHSSTSIRVNDEARLVIDNGTPVEIDGTRVSTYLRGSNATNDGVMSWVGIINASANDVLKMQVRRESEVDAGSHRVDAAETGITIAKLPDTADYIRLGETGGGQNLSLARSAITWDQTIEEDGGSFDHDATNTSRINIDADGDFLFFHSMYASRAAGSGTREAQFLEWRKNGSTLFTWGSSGQFNRGDQGSYDARTSGSSSGMVMNALLSSDYIELTQTNEAADSSSTYQANRMGIQGVKISTLFGTTSPLTKQSHFRWRDDTTALNTGGSWLAAEDTDLSSVIPHSATAYRLRISVANSGDAAEGAARTYELQYGEKNGTCAAVSTWTGLQDNGSDAFDMSLSSQFSEGAATTASLLTNAEGYTRVNGEGRETADTTGSIGPLAINNYTELEYSIVSDAGITPGTTYCFRLYDTTADTPLDLYSTYPELTAGYDEVNQMHFRWRDDTTALNTGGGWFSPEDVPSAGVVDAGDDFRLRISIANEGNIGEATGRTYELQFGLNSTGCSAISTWTGLADSATDAFDMSLSSQFSEGAATTASLLTNAEGYTRVNGEGRETADTTGSLGPISADNYIELEFSITTTSFALESQSYCFRLYDATADAALATYHAYPMLTMRGGLHVQKIIGSISGTTSQSETIPVPLTDTERAFLFFDFSGGGTAENEPREGSCTAFIANTTTVTVEKSYSSGECIYAIYVVEALDDEFIVRGRGSITLDGAELSDTGSANNLSNIFDTGKVFVPGMMRSNRSGSEWNELYSTIELTDSTTVTAERGSNAGSSTTVVRYEVVEWLYPGVTVQTKERTLTNLGTTYQTDSLDTAVTMNRAFLYATTRHTTAASGLSQTSLEITLTDVDEVSFRRGGGSYNSVARWWVIEFPPNTITVQRGNSSDNSGGNNNIDITIPTPVNVTKSFPISTITNSGTGTAFPRGRSRSDLQSSTLLNYNGGYEGNTAYYSWQVIDTADMFRPQLNQDSFRFYQNLNNITPTTVLANEDSLTAHIARNKVIRLRLGLRATVAELPADGYEFTLQYAQADSCAGAAVWNDVGAAGSAEVWRGYDNASVIDGATIATSLLDSASNTLANYVEQNDAALNPVVVGENNRGEWDFVLQHNGAARGAKYCFRVIRTDGAVLDTYDQYPQLKTAEPIPTTAF